jgi:hypothetical protein
MDLIVHDNIPADKMRRFHEILVATGGRYLHNPLKIGDSYMVDYAVGDYEEHSRLWQNYVTPIKEVRRDQWWRRMLRRVRLAS